MPTNHFGHVIHGIRPGTRDAPIDRTITKTLADDQKTRDKDVGREARTQNRAYGTLDLQDWTESMTNSRNLYPGGRRRRNLDEP